MMLLLVGIVRLDRIESVRSVIFVFLLTVRVVFLPNKLAGASIHLRIT